MPPSLTTSRFNCLQIHASRLTVSGLIAFRSIASHALPPSTYQILFNIGLEVYLQHAQLLLPSASLVHSSSSLKCISIQLNHGLQVHLWVHWISSSASASPNFVRSWSSESISEVIRSHSPSASLNTPDHNLNVHPQEQWRVYRDTGVTEVDRVTGSIYSADRRVYRYHLNSIHLLIQWQYTHYLSQLLVSHLLSEISWILVTGVLIAKSTQHL